MSNKGLAGSVRVNSLDKEGTSAMESHELRLDYSGQLRSIEPENEALFYRPYGDDLSISQSYEKHVEGARRNASASKLLRHSFVQFPTNIEITPESQNMMLREAVAFINKTHGGRAVFHARVDRDEKGKHGVDVFFAPRYEKKTAKGVTDWISLTKFGKERTRDRIGQKQEEKYNKKTKEWEPQFNEDGSDKMIWKDSAYFQGQVLQDEWFEHLRDVVGLDWVMRGEKKVGRDPDRLEPEEYGLQQDRAKLDQQREADIAEAIERTQIIERAGKLATDARDRIGAKSREQDERSKTRVADLDKRADELERRIEQHIEEVAQLREDRAKLEQDQMRFEEEQDKAAADLATTMDWVEHGVKNLSAAIDRVQAGTYDTEISPADMADQRKSFEALKDAAPDKRPTLGFRARFWALNFSNGTGPAPLPEKIRTVLTKAFDRVASWASEVRQGRLEAQSALEAAQTASTALTDAAEAEATQILAEARKKGDKLASVDVGMKAYATVNEMMKKSVRTEFGDEGYERFAIPVREAWAVHPDNPERVVTPATSSSLGS